MFVPQVFSRGMFHLLEAKDKLRISPAEFDYGSVMHQIDLKYSNKVISKGLILSLWDILHYSDAVVHQGEGSIVLESKFRLLIFRPLINQIIIGKIKSNDSTGLYVTLGFFDDLFVPCAYLKENSTFDSQTWIWNFNGEKLYMDKGQEIRVKCVKTEFKEKFTVLASIADDGLGLSCWY